MQLVFKQVRYKNFLSSGNAWITFDFLAAKTTLILGKNGAGKSTLIEAVHYALFGKPYRNINKPQLVNSINKRDMVVEILFSAGRHEYKIVRGMKPSVFEVYQDGSLINQNSESKEYQDVLEQNIIKMSPRTFSQIVVLASRSFVPFMTLPAGRRREITEDLLDIQVFTVMNNILKDRQVNNKTALSEAKLEQSNLKTQLEMLNKHLNSVQKTSDDLVSEKQNHLDELVRQHSKTLEENSRVESDIANIREKLATLISDDLSKSIADLEKGLIKLEAREERIRKEERFFLENDSCPTCKQSISSELKADKVNTAAQGLAECDHFNTKLTAKLGKLREQQSEIDKLNSQIASLKALHNSLQYQLQAQSNAISGLRHDLTSIQSKHDTREIRRSLTKKQGELDAINAKIETLVEERQLLDVSSVLLKDSGIKTKIVKQYIPIINKLINKYLASLDFFVNFELNENFEETIKSRHRDEFTYASFSEGEKSRIDIALLLTWRAIASMRNSASTNLLILDEAFDGSLDQVGNDELFKIIDGDNTNVVVISHRSESLSERFERTIKFEKSKNFTEVTTV